RRLFEGMGEGWYWLRYRSAPRSLDPPFEGSALEAVPFFAPRVGVVVVAVALPESGLVDRRQLDPAQPLGALPEVLAGDHEPQREPVLHRQRLAVRVRREERVRILEERERDVRGEARLGVRDHEPRGRLRLDELRELAPVHAL